MLNVIYLVFLGYESARKAVNDLIEFQPARAERSIVILLTELKCYAFLREHFTSDDLRRKRLELREDGYRRDIRKLYHEVEASAGHSDELWVQARETLPVLVSRKRGALGDEGRSLGRRRARRAVSRPTGVSTEFKQALSTFAERRTIPQTYPLPR
jgi:hypothetical protein